MFCSSIEHEKMGNGMSGSPIDKFFDPARSFSALTVLSVVVAVPALLIVHALEPDLVLPALSVLLFSIAGIAAVVALSIKAKKDSRNLNLWDVAGGLVLTGCAASVLGEPEQVAQLFEHLFERKSNSQ
jgi:hypothetical protein